MSYHKDLCSTEFKSGTGCNVGDCDRILYHDICTGKYNVVFTSSRSNNARHILAKIVAVRIITESAQL